MPKVANNNSGYFLPREEPYRPGDVGISVTFVGHPDTEPAHIRAIQARDVDHAAMMYGTLDVNEISEITMLPVWNVKRALHELGLVLMETPIKKRGPQPKKLTTKDKLLAVMKSVRWVSLHRLIELTGAKKQTVMPELNGHPKLFERRDRTSTMGQRQRYYRLRTKETT